MKVLNGITKNRKIVKIAIMITSIAVSIAALFLYPSFSGKKAIKNAETLITNMLTCPNEKVVFYSIGMGEEQEVKSLYYPYLAPSYQEKFYKKYALFYHMKCYDANATSGIKSINSTLENSVIRSDVQVIYTDVNNQQREIEFAFLFSLNKDNQIYYMQLINGSDFIFQPS